MHRGDLNYRNDSMPADSAELSLARAITSVGTADFVPATVDYLRSGTPFSGYFLSILDGAKPPEHVHDNVRTERRAAVIDRWLEGAYLLDPFYSLAQRLEEDVVLPLRDVAPDRFQRSTYFQEYYRAIRLRDEAAILIRLPDDRVLFYSIGRIGAEHRFGVRDIAGLRRVLPIFSALNRKHFADRGFVRDGAPTGEVAAALAQFGEAELTDRERQIAGLILKGHSTKSIAQIVDISPGTVKIHRKNAYRKLGISSQTELFSMFLSTIGRV